ncbi:hypothetical protein TNCV_1889981 [Trichonephila clavipes]|nr:hypothetical protein TNCV_1889981 [Trichonephila clavipes]
MFNLKRKRNVNKPTQRDKPSNLGERRRQLLTGKYNLVKVLQVACKQVRFHHGALGYINVLVHLIVLVVRQSAAIQILELGQRLQIDCKESQFLKNISLVRSFNDNEVLFSLGRVTKFDPTQKGRCSVSSLHQVAHCAPLRKEELILIADELGEKITSEMKVLDLKNLILNSEKYKNNKEFIDDYLDSIISDRISYEEQARVDRKWKEEQARLTAESQLEFEKINLEKVKLEIELGKIN